METQACQTYSVSNRIHHLQSDSHSSLPIPNATENSQAATRKTTRNQLSSSKTEGTTKGISLKKEKKIKLTSNLLDTGVARGDANCFEETNKEKKINK